jgi:hypothetical protein
MHARIGIGARDRFFQFARKLGIDRVERLGAIERHAGDAPVALVEHAWHELLPVERLTLRSARRARLEGARRVAILRDGRQKRVYARLRRAMAASSG